jgi:uncharacterized coiled-coil protein SlyX
MTRSCSTARTTSQYGNTDSTDTCDLFARSLTGLLAKIAQLKQDTDLLIDRLSPFTINSLALSESPTRSYSTKSEGAEQTIYELNDQLPSLTQKVHALAARYVDLERRVSALGGASSNQAMATSIFNNPALFMADNIIPSSPQADSQDGSTESSVHRTASLATEYSEPDANNNASILQAQVDALNEAIASLEISHDQLEEHLRSSK